MPKAIAMQSGPVQVTVSCIRRMWRIAQTKTINTKVDPASLLEGLRVSRTFLLRQVGQKDAQTQQKHEIFETLRAD